MSYLHCARPAMVSDWGWHVILLPSPLSLEASKSPLHVQIRTCAIFEPPTIQGNPLSLVPSTRDCYGGGLRGAGCPETDCHTWKEILR